MHRDVERVPVYVCKVEMYTVGLFYSLFFLTCTFSNKTFSNAQCICLLRSIYYNYVLH